MKLTMVYIRDLITTLSSTVTTVSTSISSYLDPKRVRVFPDGADEKSVSGAAGAWAQGSWVEIASSVGSSEIRIRGIHVVAVTGIHQIEIGTGAAASEAAIAKISVSTVGFYPIDAAAIAASSRLAARTASKAGGSQAATIFIHYHQNV